MKTMAMFFSSLLAAVLFALPISTVAAASGKAASVPVAHGKALPALLTLLLDNASMYSISATVSGLGGGKTVVLQNSNNEVLSFSGNSVKTFATKIASGSSYAITVKTQPADQYCAVSNGVASMGNANVNVTVACSNIVSGLRTLWVSKSGNNNNTCLGQASNACATIQKAISQGQPGDIIYIAAGTYVESSANNPYTTSCTFFDPQIASLCINSSGTPGSPITIQAAPGDEGKVIIDSESVRLGLQMKSNDYIVLRGLTFKNNWVHGVANYGQTENAVADPVRLSTGCVIENNWFFNTTKPAGFNSASISMWSSKDWIVRGNYIDGAPNGIQSYGVINALVEHNTIKNVELGVFWKDHFIKDTETRGFLDESEVRYNDISAREFGIQVNIKGAGTTEAGHNYFHHNIVKLTAANAVGIRQLMSGAFGISGNLRIEHNLVDGASFGGTRGISVDSATSTTLKGNIIVRTKNSFMFALYDNTSTHIAHLKASDYNVFDAVFQVGVDKYSNPVIDQDFNSLTAWQAALDANIVSLDFDHPDTHSKISSVANLFVDAAAGSYAYAANSAAKGVMPDGSNAGPYQLNTEFIGASITAP